MEGVPKMPKVLTFVPPSHLLDEFERGVRESGGLNLYSSFFDSEPYAFSSRKRDCIKVVCTQLGIPYALWRASCYNILIVGFGDPTVPLRSGYSHAYTKIENDWDNCTDLAQWRGVVKQMFLSHNYPTCHYPHAWESAKHDWEMYGRLLFLQEYVENKRKPKWRATTTARSRQKAF